MIELLLNKEAIKHKIKEKKETKIMEEWVNKFSV